MTYIPTRTVLLLRLTAVRVTPLAPLYLGSDRRPSATSLGSAIEHRFRSCSLTGMMIQLPNDAKLCGCRKTGAFKHSQVFHSTSCNFTGTETEFVKAGFGYAYSQLDKFRRLQVNVATQ